MSNAFASCIELLFKLMPRLRNMQIQIYLFRFLNRQGAFLFHVRDALTQDPLKGIDDVKHPLCCRRATLHGACLLFYCVSWGKRPTFFCMLKPPPGISHVLSAYMFFRSWALITGLLELSPNEKLK